MTLSLFIHISTDEVQIKYVNSGSGWKICLRMRITIANNVEWF